MFAQLAAVHRESGLKGVVGRAAAYAFKQRVRPWMPQTGWVQYGGVPVPIPRRLGDRLTLPHEPGGVPWRDLDGYEKALLQALQTHVRPGDRVVVVGGGYGVTATVAAQMAGPAGRVVCFEGDADGVELVTRTAALNGVADRLDVQHAIVGANIGVYGSRIAERVVPPRDIPSCDMLELDCEGSEIGIIRDLPFLPRAVAVETHGFLGAPTHEVRALLEARGYRVEDLGWAEPRLEASCRKHDIRVLAGVLGRA